MRGLAWTCAALVTILGIMSLNLWQGLRDERALAASLRSKIAQVAADVDEAVP